MASQRRNARSPSRFAHRTLADSGSSAPDLPVKAPTAGALDIAYLLDEEIERMHRLHSVLWAIATLMRCTFSERTPARSVLFELQQLAATGVQIAGDLLDAVISERAQWGEGISSATD